MCANPTRLSALENPEFGFTGWLYLCRLLLKNVCMDDLLVRFTTCLAAMDAQLLSSCQDCSGVEDSAVVNNSRIE